MGRASRSSAVASEASDEHMTGTEPDSVKRDDVHVTAADLLSVPDGEITEKGLRLNIDVGIQYLESWLLGWAAYRSKLHGGCSYCGDISHSGLAVAAPRRTLNDGRKITTDLIRETIASQLQHIRTVVGERRFEQGKFQTAAQLFEQMMTSSRLQDS